MNWYKIAQLTSDVLALLSKIDTRGKKGIMQANELIFKALNIQAGDILKSTAGMSGGVDKLYEVQSVNPDFSLNLLAKETGRPMTSNLFNGLKRNMPSWEKN